MDKLEPKTVYVPTPIGSFDMTGKTSVPVLSLSGMVSQQFVFDLPKKHDGWRVLDKQDNRIVMTKQELGQLLLETLIVASEGMPLSTDGKNQLVNQFLTKKGVII